ncbi:2-keto-4-pentenoate hydratase [Sabulicella rubraurantiaca]|uniref:2-keto-4-pentenoate hydratase n=1 Tax=Sabulicella rubraurantiaca TaxID=2811429 RepID=UPI001A96B4F9|nr:fumarylacetoacetate hydrolase family protein [Sabulicella rubraurantiaca]
MDRGLQELAQHLWEARRNGRTIDRTQHRLPASREEAYAIQHEIIALSGSRQCGHKIGSTSKEAQAILGTSEPGAGALLSSFLYESPLRLSVVQDQSPAVEAEFAFRIGADLPPRGAPYTREEISAAIESVAGSIEVVGSRFAGGLAQQGRFLTTADGSANIALVVGRWHPWKGQDLRQHTVTMTVDGVPRGTGTGERVLGNPLHALSWLAGMLSDTGRGLKADDIVATGTCTGLDPVSPGVTAIADFGSLGSVEIEFVSPTS